MSRRTPEERARAVVVGLDCLQGLQSARILAARGVPVVGVVKDAKHYSIRTRACERIHVVDTGGVALIDLLERLGPTFTARPLLLPCQDKNVLVVSEHRERLEGWYEMVLPSHDVLLTMMDKALFYDHAERANLPIPETFLIRTRDQARVVANELAYPAILKPPLRLRAWSRHTKDKAFVVRSPNDLLDRFDRLHEWTDALIAQRLIPGGDGNHYTCNCYFDRRGEPQVVFTSRKLRQWPAKTGQACLAEAVQNDAVVRETLRVFDSVEYRGLGYLEMKRDAVSGQYLIIEPNVGRPTGRSALAEASGVELLYTMYCDATGLPLPADRVQGPVRMKWIHLLRDLQAAASQWRRGELTLRQWWDSVKGPKVTAVFSWRDPGPFAGALIGAVAALVAGNDRTSTRDDARRIRTVALIGADGAGKTTVAGRLAALDPSGVKYIYMGANIESSNIALPTSRLMLRAKLWRYARRAAREGITDETYVSTHHEAHRAVKYGPILGMLRTANRLAEAAYRQSVSWRYQRRGYVVVYDRNMLFDAALTGTTGTRLHDRVNYRALRRLSPRVDLTVFLDAPPEVLLERKNEGSLEELARRRESYLCEGDRTPNFVVVDATRPLDDVVDDVVELLAMSPTGSTAGDETEDQTR